MTRSVPWKAWKGDCLTGAPEHIPDGTVDLFISDPPYGIDGDRLDAHYNRDEGFVVPGYVEIPAAEYGAFMERTMTEVARVLRPGGSFYLISGWTHLLPVLEAVRSSGLCLVNHLVWKYSFGVHTTRKFVTSHYHILYGHKIGGDVTFETHARFGPQEKDPSGRSLLYRDLEDVWAISRRYQPGRLKNKNELPPALLEKMILYSSRPGDLVCDFFLGGFSTLSVAVALGRRGVGFEINPKAYALGRRNMKRVVAGSDLKKKPAVVTPEKQHQRWSAEELGRLSRRSRVLEKAGKNLGDRIDILTREFSRGAFAIRNALKKME